MNRPLIPLEHPLLNGNEKIFDRKYPKWLGIFKRLICYLA